MPTIRSHHSLERFMCMIMGDPGSGKTGSLAEVINNMDKLRIEQFVIMDFDDGLDVLLPLVKEEFYDRVFYETLVDQLKTVQTDEGVVWRDSESFPKACALLNNWKTKDVDLGPSRDWGTETCLVLDSITGVGDSAMAFSQVKLKIEDTWTATGQAMTRQGKLIQMCKGLACHVIVMSHIRFMGGGGTRASVDKKSGKLVYETLNSREFGDAYPSCLGKQLPPTVGRHFNTILEMKLIGKSRKLRTVPEDRMNLKLPLFNISDELPQETGLFTVFDKFLNR